MASSARKAIAVAATLGPGWTAKRLALEAVRRGGYLKRRTPCQPWTSFQDDAAFVGDLLAPDNVARPCDSGDRLRRSRSVLKQLSNGAVQCFDLEADLGQWARDPATGFHYPDQHWSTIVDRSDVDVKLVWEASRFGWALDLLRVAVLENESAAESIFWATFDDWMQSNTPNSGVNWRCGQESSIRLVHCLLTADGLGPMTIDRQRSLCRLADVTARRVLAFIDYAISQNNNHSTSEAMGLIAAASSFPGLAVAERAMDVGIDVIVDGCRRLVFDDGSTSQYSAGYHRTFVETLLMTRMLLERGGMTVPEDLIAATERAVDFLDALVDRDDGSVPLYGAIDGGYLLTLSACPFTDFRPTVALGRAVTETPNRLDPGPWDELSQWFGYQTGGNGSMTNATAADTAELPVQVFRDAGISVLTAPAGRLTIRAGGHRFRPSHADQLHVDVWLDGQHVALDPGTWSYHCEPAHSVLKDTLAHNTVALDERGQMPSLSQFLWGDWVTGAVTAVDSAVPYVEASHDGYQKLGVSHRRRVQPTTSGWLIADVVSGPPDTGAIISWLLDGRPINATFDGQPPLPDGGLSMACANGFTYQVTWECNSTPLVVEVLDDDANHLSWHCPHYHYRRQATRLLLRASTADFTLRTHISKLDHDGQ